VCSGCAQKLQVCVCVVGVCARQGVWWQEGIVGSGQVCVCVSGGVVCGMWCGVWTVCGGCGCEGAVWWGCVWKVVCNRHGM